MFITLALPFAVRDSNVIMLRWTLRLYPRRALPATMHCARRSCKRRHDMERKWLKSCHTLSHAHELLNPIMVAAPPPLYTSLPEFKRRLAAGEESSVSDAGTPLTPSRRNQPAAGTSGPRAPSVANLATKPAARVAARAVQAASPSTAGELTAPLPATAAADVRAPVNADE
jgi:hypothetical protein